MPTSRDVAKLAGVSVATVSRTFSKRNTVAPKTVEKVLEAANQIGYMPNIIARSLKSNRTRTIGLVVPNVFNPFFFQVAAVMTRELAKYDYKLLISFNNQYNENELDNVRSLISAQVDALLFTPFFYNAELLDFLKNNQNIYVLQYLGDLYEDFDSIRCDDFTATVNVSQYLIDKGHTNISILTPDEPRADGLIHALKKNGLPVHDGTCVTLLDSAISETVIEHALLTYHPTAVITIAQEAKISLLKVVRKLGYRIPNDLSVVGYDDDAVSDFSHITTVGHDIDYIGMEISQLLLERIEEDLGDVYAAPKHKLLKTKFIRRDSVRDIR